MQISSVEALMRTPTTTEQILDLFLLRMNPPDYATDQPYYTTGSIVAAGLLRIAVIATIAFLLNAQFESSSWWWTLVLFALWSLGAYPAWVQYKKFNDHVQELHHGTLCGSCRHFNPTNQLCMVLDEHVTTEKPPCEGEAWEPR